MCSSPSLYSSCIPRGCKFISEELQGKEKKLQQNPAMLGCINLHNSKWPTFAFHAWRPETRAWIIQDKSGGDTKTQRNGHRPRDRRGHGEPEWGGHWKVTFNRPISKLPQKKKHFLITFPKSSTGMPKKSASSRVHWSHPQTEGRSPNSV